MGAGPIGRPSMVGHLAERCPMPPMGHFSLTTNREARRALSGTPRAVGPFFFPCGWSRGQPSFMPADCGTRRARRLRLRPQPCRPRPGTASVGACRQLFADAAAAGFEPCGAEGTTTGQAREPPATSSHVPTACYACPRASIRKCARRLPEGGNTPVILPSGSPGGDLRASEITPLLQELGRAVGFASDRSSPLYAAAARGCGISCRNLRRRGG